MDNATFNQLKLLHKIAEQGSISAAARKLGITTPSASHALKLLEQKIGVPLFTRTTRQLHLTEAGEQLIASTQSAMASLEQAVADIGDHQSVPTGVVKINVSRIAYQMVLEQKLGAFCQQYPNVTLDIIIDDGMTDLVANGFDVGMRFGNTLSEGVVARQLTASIRMGLYAASDYLAKYGTPQRPQDLAEHRFLYYRYHTSSQVSPLELVENGESIKVFAKETLIANSTDVLIDMAKQGVGITRIFEPIFERLPKPHSLEPVLQDYWKTYPPLYLYYRQHTQKAKRVKALVDFLVDESIRAKIK